MGVISYVMEKITNGGGAQLPNKDFNFQDTQRQMLARN